MSALPLSIAILVIIGLLALIGDECGHEPDWDSVPWDSEDEPA